ncbi:hypothetical protein N7471_002516 [Penicillium samsonianum]|uniref:uncharacterized protein n=1 Tax=Penicillium samsonianum TaxID=1882272 RepID=UPI002549325A|nr:uncharacterized protein N7471_002516 [Penicillium samsonianum]KAJ6143063.1 hypothetical protein N7471_002516 [Penicillium samsonianum]
MQINNTILTAIVACLAGTTAATTFHNNDAAYYVNVEHTDGSTTYVAPKSSVEVAGGWAYIRACQQGPGGYFFCPPGLLQWPADYGDVYFYLGSLVDAAAPELASGAWSISIPMIVPRDTKTFLLHRDLPIRLEPQSPVEDNQR